ncbi:hypothetical protein M3J09_006964 [Ascochyta lentis]
MQCCHGPALSMAPWHTDTAQPRHAQVPTERTTRPHAAPEAMYRNVSQPLLHESVGTHVPCLAPGTSC